MKPARPVWHLAALAAALCLTLRAVSPQAEAGVAGVWSTASEVDAAGFNLYRGTDPDGPFSRVNEAPIPARGDPFLGGTYVFTDSAAPPPVFYLIEEIDSRGQAARHGPVEAAARGTRLALDLAGRAPPKCSGALAGLAAAASWLRAVGRRRSESAGRNQQ